MPHKGRHAASHIMQDMEVTVKVLLEFTGESRLATAIYSWAAIYLIVAVLRILVSLRSPASRD